MKNRSILFGFRFCFFQNKLDQHTLRIQVRPKNPGMHQTNPILVMGPWNPKNPILGMGQRILRDKKGSIKVPFRRFRQLHQLVQPMGPHRGMEGIPMSQTGLTKGNNHNG